MYNLKPDKYDIKEYQQSKHKNITLSEMFGRYFFQEYLKKWYSPNNIMFTKPLYDTHDVELDTNLGRCFFEIKMRNKTYPTMLLEVDKYKSLIQTQRRSTNEYNNPSSYYVNITTDTNKVIYWDLNDIDINKIPVEQKNCPRTTYSDRNDYILKDCFMLPIKEGKEISYTFSINELKNQFEKQLNNE